MGSFEVFRIENNKSEKIFSKKTEKEKEGKYDEDFLSSTINYFNKKIYVSCFYKNNIYIYDILLNQLQLIMNFNDEIFEESKYFLNYKNVYDFLFVETYKQCNIYELNNFSLKNKLFIQNIKKVLLSEISNKMCFIISYKNRISNDEIIIIIDFISNDIIYKVDAINSKCLNVME